jgi:hypothetical protein
MHAKNRHCERIIRHGDLVDMVSRDTDDVVDLVLMATVTASLGGSVSIVTVLFKVTRVKSPGWIFMWDREYNEYCMSE